MCLVCREYALGTLTWDEAWNNAQELTDEAHQDELIFILLQDQEDPYDAN